MVTRQFWQQAIESAWLERPVVWLTGVRRVGKTTLVRSLPDSRYFDCELPRIRRQMEEDPEGFLQEQGTGRLVLDEIHRIQNPSELLKIAADHFPQLRVLATGSSTLTTDAATPHHNRTSGAIEAGLQHLQAAIERAIH